MLNHVWGFLDLVIRPIYSANAKRKLVTFKKYPRNEAWQSGRSRGHLGPLDLENRDTVLENLSPLAQIPLMKLLCKKQLIIYINNIKIIIIN